MSNMVQAQVMHDESRPVTLRKLMRDVACHVLVYLYEVLSKHRIQ